MTHTRTTGPRDKPDPHLTGRPANTGSFTVQPATHTFVVPTFGRSPYLEECLESLDCQRLRSKVVVSTSSPFPGLEALAERYGARLHVHARARGIGADWNAALDLIDTEWATIAHQDDVYAPEYTSKMLAAASDDEPLLILFCAAKEIRDDGTSDVTMHMRAKRALTELAFLGRTTIGNARAKQRLLAFGNPVVCPSVMFNLGIMPGFRFREDLRSNLDWAAWLEMARQPGKFGYVRDVLVHQRTHAQAETTVAIASGIRREEDAQILSQIWRTPVDWLILRIYMLGYRNRRSVNGRAR